MNLLNLKDFLNGWVVGDFDPSIIRSKDIEIGILHHTENDKCNLHIHKQTTEINIITKGKMRVNGKVLFSGDIFIIYPMQLAEVEFLEDVTIVVLRTPSIPTDKFCIKYNETNCA